MSVIEILLIALGLSMDAFAVSLCRGLAMKRLSLRKCLMVGLWFGSFQAIMPLAGYFLGSILGDYIAGIDHWIAFILLTIIGGKMLKESFQEGDDACIEEGSWLMLTLAVATSVDALAVGITFALLPSVDIGLAVGLIGLTTFVLSAVGVTLGHRFGEKQGALAERLGGIILIGIGLKILIEHLGLLPL